MHAAEDHAPAGGIEVNLGNYLQSVLLTGKSKCCNNMNTRCYFLGLSHFLKGASGEGQEKAVAHARWKGEGGLLGAEHTMEKQCRELGLQMASELNWYVFVIIPQRCI